jgi:hypothetical protein
VTGSYLGVIEGNAPKARHVGPERVTEHESIEAVVLRTGRCVPVAEAVELLRIDRVDPTVAKNR